MFSEKKKIFETFFCSEVSVFMSLTVTSMVAIGLQKLYAKMEVGESCPSTDDS
jgi:hypothetical protein